MRATKIVVILLGVVLGLGLSAVAQVWQVQSADYGAGNRRQDVTNTVRRLVDGPNFRVNNNTMGVDPARGADKTLRIVGRAPNGTTRDFMFREGSMVNARMFVSGSGWRPGGGWGGGNSSDLRIMQANWTPLEGRGGSDVTAQLQGMVRNNRLSMIANNQTLGDPTPGRSKKLYVVYQYRGRVNKVTVGENARLNLP